MNPEINYIKNNDLSALIAAKKITVIDVRTLTEFEEGHIWSALHRPVDTLPNSVRDIPKTASIVTICNKGHGRSEAAMNVLKEAGWKDVRWLEGGYLGWVEAGLPDFEPGFASS